MTNNKVKLLSVPENFILSILKTGFGTFDSQKFITSNVLLVGKYYENLFSSNDVLWINVIFKFMDDSKLLVKRRLHVIYIPNLSEEVLLSEDDAFNLMKTEMPSCYVPFTKPECEISFDENHSSEKPVKAVEVKICLLNNFTDVEPDVIDVILLNYFRYKRFLYKNDIFSVDVMKYLPDLQYTKGYSNLSIIYFKICDIRGPDFVRNTNCGYLVDDSVLLYQLKTQNAFVPPKSCLICNHHSYEEKKVITDFIKPLLPLYLNINAEKLMDYFRPFLTYNLEEIQLKPLFMVTGPVGCGKTLLLSSVAKLLGLQYSLVECSSLIVGPSGFNEAKMKLVFSKMKKNLPCLLQLRNIEVLGEDRDGNKDTRIVSYFNKLLTEIKSDLPFIVVGTTSCSDKLNCDLLQSILHVINIESPSLEERSDAISWICPLPQSTALKVAAKTSGFSLSDLSFLASETAKEKYKYSYTNLNKDMNLEYEDFSKIIDRMNSQAAGAIGAPQVPAVAWTDVGGHNEIKREIVRSLNTADFGTGLRRSGILLWGPPGTGKTLLAKAVANECNSTFLSVKGPELLNMYVGQSEQNVRQVFERAREAAPCIIFFDELDSLAPNRGKGDSAGVMDRVVSQLLSEMDGLQKNDGVFVLGATNRPDLIDPALLRPGRLDKMLYVGPCEGTEAKLSVLKALTRKFKLNSDVDLFQIADSLPLCLTGAELYSVCYNAWQNAARTVIRRIQLCNDESSDTVVVSADDFVAAVNNLSLAS